MIGPAVKIGLVGAVAAFAGSFLPWVLINTEIGWLGYSGVQTSGVDYLGLTDGGLTAIAAGVALVLGFSGGVKGARGRIAVAAASLASVVGLAVTTHFLMNFRDIAAASFSEYGDEKVGYGLRLCIGGFGVSALAFLYGALSAKAAAGSGAGGDRTHDPGIMSPLL